MARKPRVEFPGGFYHVIARGNRRATLFHDDADYEAYLERLERYRRRDGLRCYAYVLMPNHVHLLVETGVVPLSAGKGGILFFRQRYTWCRAYQPHRINAYLVHTTRLTRFKPRMLASSRNPRETRPILSPSEKWNVPFIP